MSTRTAALFLVASYLGAGCGSDARVELTISPSASLPAAQLAKVESIEVSLSGADTAVQTFSAHTAGNVGWFADGTERVVFMPRPDAQGSLVVDVIARDSQKRIMARGSGEAPLLKGQGLSLQIVIALPEQCQNGYQDGDEGDVDCGGSKCDKKCDKGQSCRGASDCAEGSCVQNQCAPAACGNGVKDGDETDLDCGGSCPACVNNMLCNLPHDCRSAFCAVDGHCTACSAATDCASGDECLDGVCKPPGSTTRPCTIVHGTGTQTFMGNEWGPCMGSACDPSYHLAGTACESDTRTCVVGGGGSGVQTWNGTSFGACMATGCPGGQHIENNVCTSDKKSCVVANGQGQQTWNGSAYDICLPTACNSGYHAETTTCELNTKPCTVGNGTGTQTWNGSGFGQCMIQSCSGDNHVENNQCTSNSRSCTVANGTGSQLWNGMAYGMCMATNCNGGYHIEAGACAPNSRACSWPNGTGTQNWNFVSMSYDACQYASCNAGYHNNGMGTCVVNAPTIASITPNPATACGCVTFTINGTNYSSPTSLTIVAPNNSATTTGTNFVSATQVTVPYCDTNAGTAATYQFYVTAAGGNSNQVAVVVGHSSPTLTNVSPSSVATNSLYCPTFSLGGANGACQGALWEAFTTSSGGAAVGSLATNVGLNIPGTATTSGAGCLSLAGVAPGTYYLGIKNPDGYVSNRLPVTVTP